MNLTNTRKDFPILSLTRKHDSKPLVYFDNAATTHKPKIVIKTIKEFYSEENSTVRRGLYDLSNVTTERVEKTREKIKDFLNAKKKEEIIFTSGCTEAINLVATCFGRANKIKANNEIIVSLMEHHANFVPWQMLAQEKKAKLKFLEFDHESGELKLENLEKLITEQTKLICLTHLSNVLGTINDIKTITQIAHKYQIPVLVDGSQSTPHLKIDLQELDCDFYCFSGHKIFGPTGVGVLYGKEKLLEQLPPYQFGGDIIEMVSKEKTTFNQLPKKFEAGTPPIAQIIGLGVAIDYIEKLTIKKINLHEDNLVNYLYQKLSQIEGIKIIGGPKNRSALVSFYFEDKHAYDLAVLLNDLDHIAIRVGQHCAEPLLKELKIVSLARASLAFYNTKEEIDQFVFSLEKAKNLL